MFLSERVVRKLAVDGDGFGVTVIGLVQLRELDVLMPKSTVERERVVDVRLRIIGASLAQQGFSPTGLGGAGAGIERGGIPECGFGIGILMIVEQRLREIKRRPKFLGLLIGGGL